MMNLFCFNCDCDLIVYYNSVCLEEFKSQFHFCTETEAFSAWADSQQIGRTRF